MLRQEAIAQSVKIINLDHYIHAISDEEAMMITQWRPQKHLVVIQAAGPSRLKINYIKDNQPMSCILEIEPDNSCYSLDTNSMKKAVQYPGILDAIKQIAGSQASILRNLEYAESVLKKIEHGNCVLTDFDEDIREIIDISAAYGLAVNAKSDEAEEIHANFLAHKFKRQLSPIESKTVQELYGIFDQFEMVLKDDLETDYTRYKCYLALAQTCLFAYKSNPQTYRYLGMFAWCCLCEASTYAPRTAANQINQMLLQHTVTFMPANTASQVKDFHEIKKLQDYPKFSEEICDFIFSRITHYWRQAASASEEASLIVSLFRKLIGNINTYAMLDASLEGEINKLNELGLEKKTFRHTTHLFNYLVTCLTLDLSKSKLLSRYLTFIEKNSIYFRKDFIFNYTTFDDTNLQFKKRNGNYFPGLFDARKTHESELALIFSNIKQNDKITIDAHCDGKTIDVILGKKIVSKSAEEFALVLAKLLSQSKVGSGEITINLIICHGAGSEPLNILPENSFAFELCQSLIKNKINATVIARSGVVRVDSNSGQKSASLIHHKAGSKFLFKGTNNDEIMIQCFNYDSRSWENYTPKFSKNSVNALTRVNTN